MSLTASATSPTPPSEALQGCHSPHTHTLSLSPPPPLSLSPPPPPPRRPPAPPPPPPPPLAAADIATTEAEAGDTSNLKTVDLADAVANVVDLYDAVAEDQDIALATEIGGSAIMLGDKGLLVRMLANVVDNAIKFSKAGGRVAIVRTEGSSHVLSVSDLGPGLAADIRDRAFDRFARGAATASVPGHGLGAFRGAGDRAPPRRQGRP